MKFCKHGEYMNIDDAQEISGLNASGFNDIKGLKKKKKQSKEIGGDRPRTLR